MISEQLIKILQKHPGKEVLLGLEGGDASSVDDASIAYVDSEFTDGVTEELWEPEEIMEENDPESVVPAGLKQVLVLYPVD